MERSTAVTAVFEPVARPSMFEETVERLGTAIRVGLLAPGTQLPPERELAEQLGISRSTLRHALTTLVQSGLLASARGRGGGTFVAQQPPLAGGKALALGAAARDVLDDRVMIETGAAVLAAERCNAADLEALRALVDRMAGAASFEDYRRADIRFHISLAEATRSPRLTATMTEVQGRMSELIAQIPHPEEVLTHSNAQHRRLVTLLKRRCSGEAVELLREHLAGTEHILEGLMPPNP
jgi:GntR family transcriptional regulator, transcriptional repressor for pyruvate dehydrogenase complex